MPYDMFGNKIRSNPYSLDITNPYSASKASQRDSRRAFTKTQKNEILYQQDNKCAVCHTKLDPRDIEYDHKKPWAFGGRTKTVNGRALCGSCHNKVTHKTKLKKVDKERKTKRRVRNPYGLLDVQLPKIRRPKRGFFY